jgi:hypothetical protein
VVNTPIGIRRGIVLTARILAILLTVVISVGSALLLFVPQPVEVVKEVPLGYEGVLPVERILNEGYKPAAGYLAASALLLLGLVVKKLIPLAWIGIVFLIIWSVLFLFSSGAAFLPAAGILILLLGVVQYSYLRVNAG